MKEELHFAALFGLTDTVKLLLDEKADLHKADDNGITAIKWAAYKGLTNVVKFSLDAGSKNSFTR